FFIIRINSKYKDNKSDQDKLGNRGSRFSSNPDLCAKTNGMNWVVLIIAGLFEVAFAACLGKAKEATGAMVYWWYGAFLVCLTISMVLLIKATQSLPIGTAYAVWTGIGAVGTALV